MRKFKVVIFDLDGVITNTALVHASAWKKMFDNYLISREKRYNEPFREFTHSADYLPYLDGKPRYKGVESFLQSRGIDLPYGDPSDDGYKETICGLGNQKNIFFNEVLDEEGVQCYDSTVQLIKDLKQEGIKVGVASSSKNCKSVLEKAGLIDLFETRVDGVISAETGLKGKPEPDIFTTACDNLNVCYHESVVVEDAESGVQAGAKGNFGFVLGIAREDNIKELYVHGADLVVKDLQEIDLDRIDQWFTQGLKADGWGLTYHNYDQKKERAREALLAAGNGYFATRGAFEESSPNEINYPGTYMHGMFNRLISKVADRDIENEDFVNLPNWLPISISLDGEQYFSINPDPSWNIIEIKRHLNFQTGELTREMKVEDPQGKQLSIKSSRFASMDNPNKAALHYSVTPLNFDGNIFIRSKITGDHINAGVKRYSQLNQQHLQPLKETTEGHNTAILVKTTQSGIETAVAAGHKLFLDQEQQTAQPESFQKKGVTQLIYHINVNSGQTLSLEKCIAIHSTLHNGDRDPLAAAQKTVSKMEGYDKEFHLSRNKWDELWKNVDIQIEGDRKVQKLLRLHLYHSLVTASPHFAKLDAGIPPRGLHGEAYRGHIFWDELYILPFYNIHFPDIVRSTIQYRHKRLDKAREYARAHGYEGAMFPWQSGSDGREETQIVHLNPLTGKWGDDYSSLQRHVSLAIAYNIWNYYRSTQDLEFMKDQGAEIFLEISRFWASKCYYDNESDRYHINKVMGPDEFHEKLPDSNEGGLTDNAYTNIMVSWLLDIAFRILDDLPENEKNQVFNKINLSCDETDRWKKITKRLALNISGTGIIEQFKGYFDLKELDWDAYRDKYDNIHRMDRILKSEGRSADEYKLSKQADLLMSYFILGEEKVNEIIKKLGYNLPEDALAENYDYYISRTSHGSSLSRLVHSVLAFQLGREGTGWSLLMEALQSDLNDIQGGTTGEGIHCGVMTGTCYALLCVFAGLDLHHEKLRLNPNLPDHWENMSFNLIYRGNKYYIHIDKDEIKIKAINKGNLKIKIDICNQNVELSSNETFSMRLNGEEDRN